MSSFLRSFICSLYVCIIMKYMKLTDTEIEKLTYRLKTSTNKHVIMKSHCLLLSNKKMTIKQLSIIFYVSRRTIERWFVDWETNSYDSLILKSGRGAKSKLLGLEQEVKNQIRLHSRNLNEVLNYLKTKHKVNICCKTLSNFLKTNGL